MLEIEHLTFTLEHSKGVACISRGIYYTEGNGSTIRPDGALEDAIKDLTALYNQLIPKDTNEYHS